MRVLRTNALEAALDDLVKRLPGLRADPLEPLWLVVPSSGLGRWIQQGLAWRLGVSANLRIEFAGSLIWSLASKVLPDLPAQSPFAPAAMTWCIHQSLQVAAAKPEGERGPFHPLNRFFSHARPAEYYQLAAALALQFDRYLAFRLDWLDHWRSGRLLDLGTHEAWQALLWRDLLSGLAMQSVEHPLARLEALLSGGTPARKDTPNDRSGDWPTHLPANLTILGLEGMAPRYARIFCQLSRHVKVEVVEFLPTQSYIRDLIVPRRARTPEQALELAQAEQQNLMLARWGRSSAESLESFLNAQAELPVREVDSFHPPKDDDSLLSGIQHALAYAEPLAANTKADDALSVQIHACHSLLRQLEVLHEVLLACVEDLPDLRLDQIVVHCPDLEAVESTLPASWGIVPFQQALSWRVVGGRGRENQVIETLLAWLRCTRGPLSARDLIALGELPLMQHIWNIDSAGLARWSGWLARSGARAGLDLNQHDSLARALDRLVAGFAVDPQTAGDAGTGAIGASRSFVYPVVDQVTSEGDDGIGALDNLFLVLHRMEFWRDRLAGTATVPQWFDRLQTLIDELFARLPFSEAQALARLRIELAQLSRAAQSAAAVLPVNFDAIEAALQQLAQQSAQGAAPTGAITFAPAGALRHIPSRVSVWLQLEDQSFPASRAPNDWDLMHQHTRSGDPNPQSLERGQFLDSLVSTRDRFIVFYNGFDERSNEERKASVLVDDLKDFHRRTFPHAPIRSHAHPVHAFSSKSGLSRRYLRTWAQVNDIAGAQRVPDLPFVSLNDSLPLDSANVVSSVEQLLALPGASAGFVSFFVNPSRSWLQRCLQFNSAWQEPLPPQYEDYLSLAGLQALLRQPMARKPAGTGTGLTGHRWNDHPQLSGFPLDSAQRSALLERAQEIDRFVLAHPGSVIDFVRGDATPYHLIRFWIHHLLHCARLTGSSTEHSSFLYSIKSGTALELDVLPHEQTIASLQTMLDIYRQGLSTPWPFFLQAAFAYAKAPQNLAAIENALHGQGASEEESHGFKPDMQDESHALVWRSGLPDNAVLFSTWKQLLDLFPSGLVKSRKDNE